MGNARLNFIDHPDATFSCMAIFFGGYNPLSPSHQTARILEQHINGIHDVIASDEPDETEASRPTLETEAHLHLMDEGAGFRANIKYVPTPSIHSPAHRACLQAHTALEFLCRAMSDAIVQWSGMDVQSVVSRDRINARNGN